jgi:hypothetical protein
MLCVSCCCLCVVAVPLVAREGYFLRERADSATAGALAGAKVKKTLACLGQLLQIATLYDLSRIYAA